MVLTLVLVAAVTMYADVKIVSFKGNVQVRRGINEHWQQVSVGDVLKPEDSIKMEKQSSAVIIIDGKLRLEIPDQVIVDLSDLRNLTQQELLLMLAMERVRSVGPQKRDDDLLVPRTTTMHGSNREPLPSAKPPVPSMSQMQLNGTKVLYEHGFYATCVIKSKEIFRTNLEMLKNFDARLRVAGALEQMNLIGETLEEYSGLLSEHLSLTQRSFVEQRIAGMKKKDREK